MTPDEYIKAARVPESLEPQSFGLWTIRRTDCTAACKIPAFRRWIGFESMTLLHRFTEATMHTTYGEVVMEDSRRELRRHLPIWLCARGKVLVSGLGLGCVVRGLLASPDVESITVVEIDSDILRVVGPEFHGNDRVTLIEGDALKLELREDFDYAWHDIFAEGHEHLQVLHARLIHRFHPRCRIQGAWQLPRPFKRKAPEWVIG
jgi:hypothetical protein